MKMFRQDKSTDINAYKLYGVTRVYREDQHIKRSFIWIDLDFKNEFNSMSQAFLWVVFEDHDIPDIDLLKSFYEYTTVGLPHLGIDSRVITLPHGYGDPEENQPWDPGDRPIMTTPYAPYCHNQEPTYKFSWTWSKNSRLGEVFK
jgi:hypothetical protein